MAATAIQPANQNNMVKASAARIPNLCAAVGYRLGVMTRYATARRVQTEVKIKKLMEAGDHHHDQAVEAAQVRRALAEVRGEGYEPYASVPSTMIAKRSWTARIGSMRASMKAMLNYLGILLGLRYVVVVEWPRRRGGWIFIEMIDRADQSFIVLGGRHVTGTV